MKTPSRPPRLTIASYNIHKGFSPFNTRLALAEQRESLQHLNPDIVLLQEVLGAHRQLASRHHQWPEQGPLAFLSERYWPHFAYSQHANYPNGHHGNAILCKYPLSQIQTLDISMHAVEQRGLLHTVTEVAGRPLHILNLHLGLLAKWRRLQLMRVAEHIEQHIPMGAPLIVGGDFNDWTGRAGEWFAKRLQLHEVFEHHQGALARSFPAWLPLLKLDRLYVRGLRIVHTDRHWAFRARQASDHVIVLAQLEWMSGP